MPALAPATVLKKSLRLGISGSSNLQSELCNLQSAICNLQSQGNRNVNIVSDAAVAHAGAPPGM
jgi:hypothetical protein